MSRRTGAQRRAYERKDSELRGLVQAFERQRTDSAILEGDDVRAWAKRSHAVARAHERHGVVIDLFGLREIEGRIKTGRTVQTGLVLLGHTERDFFCRRTSLWMATLSGRAVPIVYDHDAEAITTVLPMDAHQLRLEGGSFVRLAGGGTKTGREYWAMITS